MVHLPDRVRLASGKAVPNWACEPVCHSRLNFAPQDLTFFTVTDIRHPISVIAARPLCAFGSSVFLLYFFIRGVCCFYIRLLLRAAAVSVVF
ncbi:hypothetical protein JTB14_037952 [Gonioctena quinquepunctata]|nr:hypothetical protein JTB14_037952 [Gonioctena quinquepunctata]